jgi:hypothetical protein
MNTFIETLRHLIFYKNVLYFLCFEKIMEDNRFLLSKVITMYFIKRKYLFII